MRNAEKNRLEQKLQQKKRSKYYGEKFKSCLLSSHVYAACTQLTTFTICRCVQSTSFGMRPIFQCSHTYNVVYNIYKNNGFTCMYNVYGDKIRLWYIAKVMIEKFTYSISSQEICVCARTIRSNFFLCVCARAYSKHYVLCCLEFIIGKTIYTYIQQPKHTKNDLKMFPNLYKYEFARKK